MHHTTGSAVRAVVVEGTANRYIPERLPGRTAEVGKADQLVPLAGDSMPPKQLHVQPPGLDLLRYLPPLVRSLSERGREGDNRELQLGLGASWQVQIAAVVGNTDQVNHLADRPVD